MINKSNLLKWIPHTDQDICERRLKKIMKRLKVDEFNFNWDRRSCFIEFKYHGDSYRMEHTVDKAREKGVIVLRNGTDCLMELIQSLEDLCQIIERGTYELETWVSGMKLSSPKEEEPSEFLEEVHIRYKSLGKQKYPEYDDEELIHNITESSLRNVDRGPYAKRSRG